MSDTTDLLATSVRLTTRRVCFVTGTRAEYGLMRSTLQAIRSHPTLSLLVVATGMHLNPGCGDTLRHIREDGFAIDATVSWPSDATTAAAVASATGSAMANLSATFQTLRPDVVLIVGDRVEAYAAASAAHLGGTVVAHVHGGDRAAGQVDDALRHAITKLSHLHFPATPASGRRVVRLGEQPWRVHVVGTPGLDDLHTAADADVLRSTFGLTRGRYALLTYHPQTPDDARESRVAGNLFDVAAASEAFDHVVVIDPNTDPGARGVRAAWDARRDHPRLIRRPDVARPLFLGLMRDASIMLGNSSAGIIEAASFGTPVIDVGRRQFGRQRSGNVIACRDGTSPAAVRRALAAAVRPGRWTGTNVYGSGGTAGRIADVLATQPLDERLRHKVIRY